MPRTRVVSEGNTTCHDCGNNMYIELGKYKEFCLVCEEQQQYSIPYKEEKKMKKQKRELHTKLYTWGFVICGLIVAGFAAALGAIHALNLYEFIPVPEMSILLFFCVSLIVSAILCFTTFIIWLFSDISVDSYRGNTFPIQIELRRDITLISMLVIGTAMLANGALVGIHGAASYIIARYFTVGILAFIFAYVQLIRRLEKTSDINCRIDRDSALALGGLTSVIMAIVSFALLATYAIPFDIGLLLVGIFLAAFVICATKLPDPAKYDKWE